MNYEVGQYFFSLKHKRVFKITSTRLTNKGKLYVCEWPVARDDGNKISSYYGDRIKDEAELIKKADMKNYLAIYGA